MSDHVFRVTATEQYGVHTGRRRYHVECVICDTLMHKATTSPEAQQRYHERHPEEVTQVRVNALKQDIAKEVKINDDLRAQLQEVKVIRDELLEERYHLKRMTDAFQAWERQECSFGSVENAMKALKEHRGQAEARV